MELTIKDEGKLSEIRMSIEGESQDVQTIFETIKRLCYENKWEIK
jgi:hypothetical protein